MNRLVMYNMIVVFKIMSSDKPNRDLALMCAVIINVNIPHHRGHRATHNLWKPAGSDRGKIITG